jgi:hypothetical protein
MEAIELITPFFTMYATTYATGLVFGYFLSKGRLLMY